MRRRTMHLSSADATPERLPQAAKQHRRSSGQVRTYLLLHLLHLP